MSPGRVLITRRYRDARRTRVGRGRPPGRDGRRYGRTTIRAAGSRAMFVRWTESVLRAARGTGAATGGWAGGRRWGRARELGTSKEIEKVRLAARRVCDSEQWVASAAVWRESLESGAGLLAWGAFWVYLTEWLHCEFPLCCRVGVIAFRVRARKHKPRRLDEAQVRVRLGERTPARETREPRKRDRE